jgi:2-deoxy-D-gluconate 3-dehydrogenase
MDNLFDLSGRVAVVTGGSRGIGRMIAEGFVRGGVKTYITARKAEACEQAAREMSEHGDCIALPHDLSTLQGIDAFVADVHAREDHLDILVNNAGAAWGEEFDKFSEEGWDKVMNLNAKSLFFLTQRFAPMLRKGAAGDRPAKVINIASIDGLRTPDLETYSYVTSKAGVIHLTRRLAKRLIADNICVNAIAPGAFASDMNIWARDNPDVVSQHIPARRVGTAEDMAAAAIFLAARSGDYLVGTTLTVDGGVTFAG